jgi:NRPS condensation-like uncharacterized protein
MRRISKIPQRLPAVALDRLFYESRVLIEQQFHYVVAFEGRLDEARLCRAVRLAMDREPVFGCRYVPAKRPYWERRGDLDSLPLCEVNETAAVQRELERFAARPLDATRDPLVQACIVRGASDTLCLKVNHVAADAGGGKDLLYSIAALYGALEDPAYRPTPNLGDRGMGQLFRRYGWQRSLAAARYRIARPPQNVWQFPTGDLQDMGVRVFAARILGPEQSKALREYARGTGVTPNDVLLAALFRALWRSLDFPLDTPQAIWVPMDFRPCLPSGRTEAVCNFIGMMYPSLAQVPGESFEATLRRVEESSVPAEDRERFALFFALLAVISHRVFLERVAAQREQEARRALETRATGFHFSNIRTLNESKLDFGLPLADVDLLVPAAVPPGLLMAAFSFRDRMKFVITYFSRAMKKEDVERFFDTFMEELSPVTARPALAAAAQARS